jgi:hypothetical protein
MVEEVRSGVGLRHVQALALDANGYPNATSTTAEEGVHISGANALEITDPEPRRITHMGDDRVIALDVLPPTEPVTGVLTTSKVNDDVDAILGDDKSFTVGAAEMFGVGTDNRGDENQVCLLAFQQALDTDPKSGSFGIRRWNWYLIPKALLVRQEGGLGNDPTQVRYSVYPQFTKEHVWGVAFTTTTEGFEQAQALRGVSQYKPKIVAYNGDTATTTFAFPSATPAASTATVAVWVDGAVNTPTTVTTTNVTLAAAPDTDSRVVILYEYA